MSFLLATRGFLKQAPNPLVLAGGFATWSFFEKIAVEKRRKVKLAAFLAELSSGAGQGPQGPKMKKEPFNWERHLFIISPLEFRLYYRLSYSGFMELLDVIRPLLEAKDKKQASRSKGGALVRKIKL